MSRAAKLTLASTSLAAAGIVVFVHYAQRWEKAVSLKCHLHKQGGGPVAIQKDWLAYISNPFFSLFKTWTGNARWSITRHGATESEEGATGGFWNAASAGGGVSSGSTCALIIILILILIRMIDWLIAVMAKGARMDGGSWTTTADGLDWTGWTRGGIDTTWGTWTPRVRPLILFFLDFGTGYPTYLALSYIKTNERRVASGHALGKSPFDTYIARLNYYYICTCMPSYRYLAHTVGV